MSSGRKLPADPELIRLADQLSTCEIGERFGTSGEAVRQALQKAGYVKNTRPTHGYYIPWTIRADHSGHVLARRLRSYSKRQQGKPLTDTENRLLDEWLVYMDGGNSWGVPLSVHYDRNDDEGFWLAPRRAGDRHYVAPPVVVALVRS